jgi:Leucine-rich repeat (LRR) protein
LKGSLELRGFMQLESLNCSENNLTYLDVSECYKLVFLDCSSNQLTSLKLPSNSKLSCVIARNNNLLSVDLSLFSGMTNLKSLDIGNTSFYGSLEPLKDLKLEEL